MNIDESKILLSIDMQGGFDTHVEGLQHHCIKKVTLGPDFISRALHDPNPAYTLKVLRKGDSKRKYYSLTDNMKLHLHIKQYVADYMGIDFGGKLENFKWELV